MVTAKVMPIMIGNLSLREPISIKVVGIRNIAKMIKKRKVAFILLQFRELFLDDSDFFFSVSLFFTFDIHYVLRGVVDETFVG